MIPALIDLHLRPTFTEAGLLDVELVTVQARDRGLDGVVVFGRDQAVPAGDTAAATAATGVHIFFGVELPTERGLLLCYPRVTDDWFRDAGWRNLARVDGAWSAEAVVQAFTERGGAVVAMPTGEHAPVAGVHGILVAATTVDDAAVGLAQNARLACVGGSGSVVGDERFGSVATVFASPPAAQTALVEGLRSGRAWPVEIGTRELAELSRPAPTAARSPSAPGRGHHDTIDLRTPARPPQAQPTASTARPRPKLDAHERPGDNRGNRLNRDEVRRIADVVLDDAQPTFDPVAAMYGLDARKVHRFAHKSDEEIDRINGNRARGPDANVMWMPNFDELRQERQRVSLLFARTEEEVQLEDSISLRFALAHYGDDEDALADLPSAPAARRRNRRRR